jgi:hypothetical protein
MQKHIYSYPIHQKVIKWMLDKKLGTFTIAITKKSFILKEPIKFYVPYWNPTQS